MSMVASASKAYMVLLVVLGLLLLSHQASARKLLANSQNGESSTELKIKHAPVGSASTEDKKNFIAYGGMGHYSGVGGFVGIGLPITRGGGMGVVGGIGGGTAKGGTIGGGIGGGIAKGGAIGGGVGVLPHP